MEGGDFAMFLNSYIFRNMDYKMLKDVFSCPGWADGCISRLVFQSFQCRWMTEVFPRAERVSRLVLTSQVDGKVAPPVDVFLCVSLSAKLSIQVTRHCSSLASTASNNFGEPLS